MWPSAAQLAARRIGGAEWDGRAAVPGLPEYLGTAS